MKIAIVHDYLTQRGGAERVVLGMLRCFPDAVLHTTIYNPATTYPEFANFDVRTSGLNAVAAFRNDPRRAMPLLPRAIASLDLAGADVVLSSTSGWAHGVRSRSPIVAYCHTPARWLYEPADYFRGMPNGVSPAFGAVRPAFRQWDQSVARRVTTYVANSQVVARRIARAYGIEPHVVHPPTTLDPTGPMEPIVGLEPGFLLTVGRRRGYKNTDLICAAVEEHTTERLVVVGEALPGHGRFSERIVSLPPVSDNQMRWLYAASRGVVAMGFEDFGLSPVEAFSLGRPAVTLRAGGYLESCVEGLTGVHVDRLEPRAIAEGIAHLGRRTWDEEGIRLHAKRFHLDRFGRELEAVLGDAVERRWPTSVLRPRRGAPIRPPHRPHRPAPWAAYDTPALVAGSAG